MKHQRCTALAQTHEPNPSTPPCRGPLTPFPRSGLQQQARDGKHVQQQHKLLTGRSSPSKHRRNPRHHHSSLHQDPSGSLLLVGDRSLSHATAGLLFGPCQAAVAAAKSSQSMSWVQGLWWLPCCCRCCCRLLLLWSATKPSLPPQTWPSSATSKTHNTHTPPVTNKHSDGVHDQNTPAHMMPCPYPGHFCTTRQLSILSAIALAATTAERYHTQPQTHTHALQRHQARWIAARQPSYTLCAQVL